MTRNTSKTWKDLIQDLVERMPHEFELGDVLLFRDRLAKEYPENQHIDAKIRQTLQILRDQGVLEFRGGGRYRRLDRPPAISLTFDPSPGDKYTSRSQMARVTMETWAELNLYCLACMCDRLKKLPDNTPLADFECALCSDQFQLKSKNGRFGGKVEGAEYKKMLAAVRAGTLPEYILAEYDSRLSTLISVRVIPGSKILEQRIAARRPLSDTARRHGWVGCTIDVSGIVGVEVIAPRAEERQRARSLWNAITRH